MPTFIFWHDVAIPIAGMATLLLIALSFIRAGSRLLERRHEARMAAMSGDRGEGVEHLRGELGQLRSQVEALEERLDFTERLLTQEKARRQVEPGSRDT